MAVILWANISLVGNANFQRGSKIYLLYNNSGPITSVLNNYLIDTACEKTAHGHQQDKNLHF